LRRTSWKICAVFTHISILPFLCMSFVIRFINVL
jgi:hypothetical protein